VEFVRGDLFASGCLVLVDPCNCVGAQGRGLSHQFADRFPELSAAYRVACASGRLRPGQLHWQQAADGTIVCRFPTKDHFRDPSRLEWIERGLRTLIRHIGPATQLSIAVPPLGCGLGGLNWEREVMPLITRELAHLPNVRVYLPR
jgi:O-acetyl-ADP-ribose deacetylase (regulator of RNase III)